MSLFRISRLVAVVATLVAVVTTGVTWRSDERRRAADAGLYEEQAYRLATTGELGRPQHEGLWTVHDGERLSTHPVGYVAYLAAIYLSYPAIGELSAECIIDTGCRAGRPVGERMHFAGSAMRGIAAAAAVLVTVLFSANVLVALAAGVVCMVLMMTQWGHAGCDGRRAAPGARRTGGRGVAAAVDPGRRPQRSGARGTGPRAEHLPCTR